MRILFSLLTFLLVSISAFAAPQVERPVATLRALDKITARVEEIDIPIGRPYKFGTIIITVDTCRVTPPEEAPEAAAFLAVHSFKPGEEPTSLFSGWMFASSPALSAMEHPLYDLWLIGCKDRGDNKADEQSDQDE